MVAPLFGLQSNAVESLQHAIKDVGPMLQPVNAHVLSRYLVSYSVGHDLENARLSQITPPPTHLRIVVRPQRLRELFARCPLGVG